MHIKKLTPDIGSLLAGILIVYSFSPFNIWPLAILSLVTFLLICQRTNTVKLAIRRGFLYGLGFYGAGSYWQFTFIGTFPVIYQPIMYFLLGGIIFILICFPVIYAATLVWIKQYTSFRWLVVLFPFVWLIGEWVRTWLWTGFPYYQLGFAFVDMPLAGFAPLGGELAVTLSVLVSVSLLAGLFIFKANKTRIAMLSTLLIIWAGGAQLQTMDWGTVGERPLKVRLVHGSPDQLKKTKRYYAIDTIKQYLAYSEVLPQPDLVIWPESSIAMELRRVYHYLKEGA
ncbi:hypothetical protein, partial [Leucothrix pacifica]